MYSDVPWRQSGVHGGSTGVQGLDDGDPAPASEVRVKSSSGEGEELTVSYQLDVCLYV